jgi:hypothetical protein
LPEEAFETLVPVFIPVAVQVIIAHLVYHDAHYQLGPHKPSLGPGVSGDGQQHAQEQKQIINSVNLSHNIFSTESKKFRAQR